MGARAEQEERVQPQGVLMIEGIDKAAESVGAGTVKLPTPAAPPAIPQMAAGPVAMGTAAAGKPTGLGAVPPAPALAPAPVKDMASAAAPSSGPIKTAGISWLNL